MLSNKIYHSITVWFAIGLPIAIHDAVNLHKLYSQTLLRKKWETLKLMLT
jgi:hypothetical protein